VRCSYPRPITLCIILCIHFLFKFCQYDMVKQGKQRSKRTRNSNKSSRGRQPVGSKDLDAQRIYCPPAPPTRVDNATVSRTVRQVLVFSAYTGAPFTYNVTPNAASALDSIDYGTSAARYSYVRINSCKIWGLYNNLPGPAIGGVAPLLFSISEGVSNATWEDQNQAGVDYATIGVRASLFSRSNFYPVAAVTTVFQISVTSGAPMATPATGTIYVDIACEFR